MQLISRDGSQRLRARDASILEERAVIHRLEPPTVRHFLLAGAKEQQRKKKESPKVQLRLLLWGSVSAGNLRFFRDRSSDRRLRYTKRIRGSTRAKILDY